MATENNDDIVLKAKRTDEGYNVFFGTTSLSEVEAVCGIVGRLLVKEGVCDDINHFLDKVKDYAVNPNYDEPDPDTENNAN